MKKILTILVGLSLVSCAVKEPYSFTYPNDDLAIEKSQVTLSKSIFIDQFKDSRKNSKQVRSRGSNLPFKYSIHEYWEKPESKYKNKEGVERYIGLNTLYGYNLDIEKDLHQATIELVRSSSLFSNFDLRDSADYILKGEIIEFRYDYEYKLYGVSALSSLIHILGFNSTEDKATIKMKYTLIEKENNKEIFSKIYSDSFKSYDTLYTNNHYKFLKSYEKLYHKINNKLVYDLSLLLSKR